MADPFRRAGAIHTSRHTWAAPVHDEPKQGGGTYRVVKAPPEHCFPLQASAPPVAPEPAARPSHLWTDELREASRQLADQVKLSLDVIDLRGRVEILARELTELELSSPGSVVPVQSFAPEPYEITKPFSVVVKRVDGEYVACFPDANLTSYGDNEHEAVENLKGMILDTFDKFSSGRKLGPGPMKQLAVLRQFIRKG